MRREGFEVNGKRVARIRKEEGIKVSKKQRRMRRLGVSTAERQRAEGPGQVWSWDFVTDQTEKEVSEVLCLGSVYFSSVGSDFAMAR
jgi:putative transposase